MTLNTDTDEDNVKLLTHHCNKDIDDHLVKEDRFKEYLRIVNHMKVEMPYKS